MSEFQGSRLRRVALTGVLTPGLILSAASAIGLAVLPGLSAAPASAESVLNAGACTSFEDPNAATATEMSVADVAEKASPAVVTVLNMQPLSEQDLSGFTGIEGIPGIPDLPGISGGDQVPSIGDQPSGELPDGSQQIDNSASDDTIVPVGSGSGFIVDDVGHVITNAHVVDGAKELTVTLSDGADVKATLVGRDDLLDVAVLKLEIPAGVKVPGIAYFGDSDALRAGDQIVAIGNALGSFPNTVSEGTVNAVDRAFPDQSGLTDMIQHDAEIWHGNSGGPLLNLKAEIVGINTAGIGADAMGMDVGSASMAFAVEGNTVCKAADALIANGKIVWPYLGIQGEANADGQTVVEVVEGGPSAAAGLEKDDVITAFDGQQLDKQHSLLDLLFGHEPGDSVSLTVDRDGATQTFQVTLGERPEETD